VKQWRGQDNKGALDKGQRVCEGDAGWWGWAMEIWWLVEPRIRESRERIHLVKG